METGILPEPMRINNVRYWDEIEIEQRERERMSAVVNLKPTAPPEHKDPAR